MLCPSPKKHLDASVIIIWVSFPIGTKQKSVCKTGYGYPLTTSLRA